LNVILYQPQIPQNTGNIVRTCAVTGTSLTLVPPLGFKTTNRHLKRAGLDYWEGVDITFCEDFDKYLHQLNGNFYFFSSKASKCYSTIDFHSEDHLIFGSETTGIPLYLHQKWPNCFYKIPMKKNRRCLNLSSAVAVVVYEAWKQLDFIEN
jgi:tRNA (cytidine/uridine-2'-O-)-methyltransferase